MADNIERVEGGHRVRIRYGKGQRQRYFMPLTDSKAAGRRAATLRKLAALLTRTGRGAQAPVILKKAAEARSEADLAEVVRSPRSCAPAP